MNKENYLKDLLPTRRVLQLATVKDNKPWLCTVHFYSDEQGRIYWVSTKERRHSLELSSNPHATATAVIHEDSPEENYVISITIEGEVVVVKDRETIEDMRNTYVPKLGKPESIIDQVLDANDSLELFCLVPSKVSVFDNKNFPDKPKQEWSQS